MARKSQSRSGSAEHEFERFDVGAAGASGFEPFDPIVEPDATGDSLLAALADFAAEGLDPSELIQAQEDLVRTLMLASPAAAFAAADEGPVGHGNVVGVGIAEKEVGGVPTGRLALKVFVKEKLPAHAVSSSSLVSPQVGGVPTDVEATGEIWANLFTARHRPAPGGVSIGHCGMAMAGTLGCLVARGNQLFLLSNNHVIALVNAGPVGAAIPQPGRLDGGVCANDAIARLSQWVPIAFGGAENLVDAAIARTSPALVDRRILRPFGVRQALVAPDVPPVLDLRVQKSGRTTQYRRGTIDAVNVTIDVGYAPLGGVARFARQFRVRGAGAPFSDRGDSGSLVTTYPGNQPVGLLFAGNAASNVTFCNPIRTVLESLGVRIVY